MTEKEKMICEMINNDLSLNEMAKILWLSPRQVHQKILKIINDGYYISPIYFDDGNIRYVFEENDKEHTINLNLCDSSKFKALVVSSYW